MGWLWKLPYYGTPSYPEQGGQVSHQEEHLHPHQDVDEGVWLAHSQAVNGLSQPDSVAQDNPEPDSNLFIQQGKQPTIFIGGGGGGGENLLLPDKAAS